MSARNSSNITYLIPRRCKHPKYTHQGYKHFSRRRQLRKIIERNSCRTNEQKRDMSRIGHVREVRAQLPGSILKDQKTANLPVVQPTKIVILA